MAERMVVDSSVATKWFLRDSLESDVDLADELLKRCLAGLIQLHAPRIMAYEVCSALVKASRRTPPRLSEDRVIQCEQDLFSLPVVMSDSSAAEVVEATKKAFAFSKGFYDMTYLHLAEKLELIEADISLQRALQLDYPVISAFNHSRAGESEIPAIDALPDGRPFWMATLIGRNVGGRLDVPGGLRILAPGGRIILMPLGVLLLGALGLIAGQWLRSSVRTFSCTSCGKIVCRRCLIRVESRPYCQDCGRTLSADCSAEYSRALLKRYFQRRLTVRGIGTEIVRRLLPGWTEVGDWAVKRSVIVLSLSSAALLMVSMRSIPVIPPPIDVPIPPVSAGYWWSAALLIYVVAHALAWRWRGDDDHEFELDDEDEPGLRVMGE